MLGGRRFDQLSYRFDIFRDITDSFGLDISDLGFSNRFKKID